MIDGRSPVPKAVARAAKVLPGFLLFSSKSFSPHCYSLLFFLTTFHLFWPSIELTLAMAEDHSKHATSPKRDSATDKHAKRSHKRKRDLDSSTADTSQPESAKKTKKSRASSSESIGQNEESQKVASDVQKGAASTKGVVTSHSKAIQSSNDDGVQPEKKSKSWKHRSSENAISAIGTTQDIDKTENAGVGKGSVDRASSKNDKFSGIMSKFQRTVKVKGAVTAKEDDVGDTQDAEMTDAPAPVVAQGLEPLPQPEPTPVQVEKPTYSSLPEWLAHPVRASVFEKRNFSDLGLNSDLLRILETNGYKEAFAVQSTVLPLLLPGPQNHPGDLCISAATGSGKTLSYVLPLVKALEQHPSPRLRGLIVVPTRELVKQARETCELLAAGSGLRIGSAIGNVAIKDEQQSLMRTEPYYSPELYEQQQRGELGEDFWKDFDLQEYISETLSRKTFLHNHVEKKAPNVDILICTPGRLVDHIRHTKGFSLYSIEWLIIDEADRLLNESFQEWVDVVMKSLDDRKVPETLGFAGKHLASMGFPIKIPEPKKVILSATMTRDISKLNTLRLANPKMVIIGSENNLEDGEMVDADDHFTLPPTLKEYLIPVGDGAEKPLYLLRLLLSHIKIDVPAPTKSSSSAMSDSSDSSDSTSDATSSDESSEASSSEDSDSDSSGDESSETDSSVSSDGDSENESKPGPARNTVLIFTKSSEAASRLSRLLSILHPTLSDCVGTIIKSNKTSASRKALTAYRRGKISVIIATDRASRGLDLRSLKHVVNYDVPASITSYVHRVGRTARAGEKGSAWTLVAHREGRWFVTEIAKGSEGKITRSAKLEKVNMKLDGMGDFKEKYTSALEMLEKEVKTGRKSKE